MPDVVMLPTIDQRRIPSVLAVETDMNSITIPGRVLRNVGDILRITAALELAANANNKASRVYVGGNVVAVRGPAADNASTQLHEVTITLKTLGGDIFSLGKTFNRSTGSWIMNINDVLNLGINQPLNIKTTGTGVNNADVESRFLKVEYVPATSDFALTQYL